LRHAQRLCGGRLLRRRLLKIFGPPTNYDLGRKRRVAMAPENRNLATRQAQESSNVMSSLQGRLAGSLAKESTSPLNKLMSIQAVLVISLLTHF
jgi:hypothetical protein